MKAALAAAATLFLSVGEPAIAHRLDEYLQATVISLAKNRIQVEVRLAPGVAVFPIVLATLDSDADGVISEAERRAYAERVLRDLSFTSVGERLSPRLLAARFPATGEMKEGRGEIYLEFDADLPSAGPRRSLTFENHHLSPISVYLVNTLIPRDPDIRITTQNRNSSQSVYRVDYAVAGTRPDWGAWGCVGAIGSLLFARLAFLNRRPPGKANAAIASRYL